MKKTITIAVASFALFGVALYVNAASNYVPFTLGPNGNVGIGSTNPQFPLSVTKDLQFGGGATGQVFIGSITNQKKGLKIGFDTTNSYAWLSSSNYTPGQAAYLPLILQRESGDVGIGTDQNTTARLDINANNIRLRVPSSPAANSTCNPGEIRWDPSYIYVCAATNQWKRATLSSYGSSE